MDTGEAWMGWGAGRGPGIDEGGTGVMESNRDPQPRPAHLPNFISRPLLCTLYFSLAVSPAKLFTDANLFSRCHPSPTPTPREIFRLPLPTSASLLSFKFHLHAGSPERPCGTTRLLLSGWP